MFRPSFHSLALLALATAPCGLALQSDDAPELVPDAGRAVSLCPGIAARSFTIDSAILEETRAITLLLPPSFARSAPERRYPVTVVLDGEANARAIAAVSDELAANGLIPESVIVAIPNVAGASTLESAEKRVHDLTPPGLSVSGSSLHEGGDRFLDFLEQELLPAVERQFRGGAPRTLVGHSSGGILATWAAATRPSFRCVVAIDTPTALGEDWLPKKLTAYAAAEPAPLRYVSYEARFGWRDDPWKALVAAAPPTWSLHRETLALESHESMGMLAMYLGLREVFRDYAMLAAPAVPTTSILPYYERVGASLGARVIPPEKLLGHVVEDLLAEGRGALAREAYELLASGYGPPADAARILHDIAEVERRPPPSETVAGLLATPFPTPDEARAFLGEWVGDVWMNSQEVRNGSDTLHLRVEDGRVIGETISAGAPPEYRVRRWEYLRITPEGMTWGYLNGMRPRGVILFEAELAGDVLSGTSRFGGIDFRLPDGSPPPVLHFSFRRVAR